MMTPSDALNTMLDDDHGIRPTCENPSCPHIPMHLDHVQHEADATALQSAVSSESAETSMTLDEDPAPAPAPEPKANAKSGHGLTTDVVYNDPEGEITLISADGTKFVIRSYYLLAASEVFRASGPEHGSLNLNDPNVDRAPAIRLFLHFVHSKIPKPTTDIVGHLRRAILIAKKLRCPLILKAMSTFAREYNKEIWPSALFTLAANLGDLKLCATAIVQQANKEERRLTEDWWDRAHEQGIEQDGDLAGSVTIADSMDPTAWGVDDVQLVPLKHFVGLMRASRDVDFTSDELDRKAIARAFLGYVQSDGLDKTYEQELSDEDELMDGDEDEGGEEESDEGDESELDERDMDDEVSGLKDEKSEHGKKLQGAV